MENQFKESFDQVLGTFRRIFPLDKKKLFFLSEFSDENRIVKHYSVDVERADDSHYEIDSENATKLAFQLQCGDRTDDLVTTLSVFFLINTEHDFEKLLDKSGITYHPFHFDHS